MKLRYESFGAIVAIDEPPALVHIDREMVRELGFPDSDRWSSASRHLSAPTEVHAMVTNRCPAGCPGCYTSAVPDESDAPTDAWKDALSALADAGVFHVALGGGESMLRTDLFELAEHARHVGLTPNLTTSGLGMTPELAERCRIFGQVNVSLDGLGAAYIASRGYDGEHHALRALKLLANAGVPTGINLVLSSVTWDGLARTTRVARDAGANEVEILRFKPTGRGREVYERFKLQPEQCSSLMNYLRDIQHQVPDITLKIDCSLVPFLCASGPDPDELRRLGVYGCEAGHALAAITAELEATPCSFLPRSVGSARELARDWDHSVDLLEWRNYHKRAPEPCGSCEYRTVCKGGCRAVSWHVLGDPFLPDPECPRVMAFRASSNE